MKCLSELYSDKGLFSLSGGVTVNRERIFHMRQDIPAAEQQKAFAQIASRVGAELTGLRTPVIGSGSENAIALELDNTCPDGCFILNIRDGGMLVTAGDWQGIDQAAEYLSVCYPELGGGETFHTQQALLNTEITAAVFDAKTLCAKKLNTQRGWVDFCPTDWIKQQEVSNTHRNVNTYLSLDEDVRIVWSEAWEKEPEAALRIFIRNAMDGFKAVRGYVIANGATSGRTLRAEYGAGEIGFQDNGLVFRIGKDGLAPLADGYLRHKQQWKDMRSDGWQKDIEDVFAGKNELGQAIDCRLNSYGRGPACLTTKGWSAAITEREGICSWLEEKTGREIRLQCSNDPKAIRSWDFEASWEGDDFIEIFSREVLPGLHTGSHVEVEGILSEDADERCAIEQKITEMIAARGAVADHVKIYRAYKSGASWIEESVIPTLAALETKPARIDIAFHYFVNECGEDTFEDESTPNYGRHEDKPQKWFDIPIRWLQELFPVDEVIERELGISRDAVTFTRADKPEHTYQLTAYAPDGTALYTAFFDAAYRQKHYMERYPQIGKTHVSTGRIRVKTDGVKMLDQQVETDPEKVWGFLEGTILPELEKYYVGRFGTERLAERQPLFNRLQIDLNFSEMDYDTGIRQERVSTPEAMQEDIYFYILDWFKTYGERECGRELDNVGLIMPAIHNRKGQKTSMRVTLYSDAAEESELTADGVTTPIVSGSCTITPLRVSFGSGMRIEAAVEADHAYERACALAELIERGSVSYPAAEAFTLSLVCPEGTVDLPIKPYLWKDSQMTEEERLDILRHRVVDYPTYLRLLAHYAKDERLRILPVGTSYKGRKMFAIELVRRIGDACYSRYKLENSRITAYFNARHHGNEASGLNSAFLLLDTLLGDGQYDALLDKLNIITLPYENIDGGEMHCEICREHPKWLAHVARYNSAGFEFRKDFSNPDTKYGEAKAEVAMWKKWLFDIVTDNHGFEGHELTQPFSGYISPWYKSFWIPRALYYGYIWYNSLQTHTEAYARCVREAVAEAINHDETIHSLNLVCAERFDKYARNWFPDLFTSTSYRDVVFYWVDTAVQKRPNNFAVLYPDITVIDWTTEVADETVTGEEFYMNVWAHLLSDLALLDVIRKTPVEYEGYRVEDGYVHIRRKPLTAPENVWKTDSQ